MQFNAAWDHDPSGYDTLRDSWLNKRKIDYCLDFLRDAQPRDTVLEIGSGTGAALLELARNRPDLSFVGIEPLNNYCGYARERAVAANVTNVRFICCDAESCEKPLKDEPQAAWILSTDVLHHVKDLRRTADQISLVSLPEALWLSLEPSYLNPYVFFYQALTPGERNFWPRKFFAASRSTWQLKSKTYINIIPSFIPRPSNRLKTIESRLEGLPFICGCRISVFSKPPSVRGNGQRNF